MELTGLVFVAILAASTHGYSVTSLDKQCPPWTSPQNESCKCGNDLGGIVKCEDGRGAYALKNCFCMTAHENGSSSPLVGTCPYTCYVSYRMTYNLKTNQTEDLTNETCGPHKRTGKMCGQCIEGYGLPVYSYNLSCVECTDYKYNWLKYIAVAYGPLTVFYFIIITFRISVTKGYMMGYVTVSQMITTTGIAYHIIASAKGATPVHRIIIKYTVTGVSMWNLDFFRSLYPPFCLHPHLSALQVLSLD